MSPPSSPLDLEERLRRFLAEDLGRGDATAEAIVPAGARARARLLVKGEGVLAGADLAEPLVRLLDPAARATAVASAAATSSRPSRLTRARSSRRSARC